MKFLFMPGAKFFLRLPNEKKLPIMTALFLLPLVILYLDVGAHASTATKAWVLGGVALALYAMASFYIQADLGWRILIASMQRISEGDLTTRIEAQMGGHFGQVMKMLERINQSLGDIVRQVRASSRTVSASAREIAEGNANLSQRTERQATTLEETASAMEEFSSIVDHNAANCTLASKRARSAEDVAREGSRVVHGVVQAMGGIEKSSKRIGEIVGVIEGIAFQTNILALNAAVEAARAGDQGRGFAVVATEVRALSLRSAEAAKEVRSLIQQSVGQVRDGSRQAEGAGKAIDDIVTGVEEGNRLVGEIASASGEQSAGVKEINRAILQLEEVTQQNAAMVEEASAKSMAFQEVADRLTHAVARFKVEEGAEAEPAPAFRASPGPKRPVLPRRPAPLASR